jgi:hypothetical protein
MVEKNEEEIKEKWVVMEVAETMKIALVDAEKKEVYSIEMGLAKILNELEQIKKAVC